MPVKIEQPTNASVPGSDGDLDEAYLEASLAKLQDMHIKVIPTDQALI